MRILHVTHDWKWTGPAEPMLRLAVALRERGHEVALACPEPPDPDRRSLAGEARAAGLEPHALSGADGALGLGSGADVRGLRDLAGAFRPDVVHAWHTRDHVLAWRALRGRRARGETSLVRSYRSAERVSAAPWNRWLLGPAADGVVFPSPGTARRNAPLRGGRPTLGVFGAVDSHRFFPKAADPGVRASLGLLPEHRVVGLVARVQPHRRFDLLLEAARRLFVREPNARLLIVGRGTQRERLAEEPARRLGIADRVVFAGYRGDDYAEVIRQIEVFTFLVPGSDGTCRALLEAAACAIPAVVSERGALPEIVLHRETGLVAEERPDALADAWAELLAEPERRADMGRAAYERAQAEFTPTRLADAVEGLYGALRPD